MTAETDRIILGRSEESPTIKMPKSLQYVQGTNQHAHHSSLVLSLVDQPEEAALGRGRQNLSFAFHSTTADATFGRGRRISLKA